MTDRDLKTISEKIESLHAKILKSRFAETVTESEMMSLVLAVRFLSEQHAKIERLKSDLNIWKDVAHRETSYVKIAKSEAVKEFAERLKQLERFTASDYYWVDKLAKEMVGEPE